MKQGLFSLSSAVILALLAAPLAAWADANPDFDDDAKPILRMQPHLLHYVESRFDVKDTGTAKFPGDDDHAPRPPFIFRARPLGSTGPYNLRLLIQPGAPGHILGVVDITQVHLTTPGGPSASPQPSVSNQAAPQQPPAPAPQPQPQPQTPAPPTPTSSPQPSEPTSDTPSGPITDSSGQATPLPPPPSSTAPNLAPPPDPAPSTH